MTSYRLLWAIGENRGRNDDTTLDDVMERLDEVLGKSGVVEMVVTVPSEIGPRGMQLRTEEGRSIITLAEVKADKSKNVRTFRLGETGEEVDVLGAKWDSRLVCKDENTVKKAFSQLFSTGEVSKELLS